MANMPQLLSRVLFLIAMLLTTPTIYAASLSIRAELTHVDSGRGFTRWELASRMAARSLSRARSLHHRGGGGGNGGSHPATVPVLPGVLGQLETEYLIHFAIGKPQPQHVALTLDTGSYLVWTQCQPCPDCFDQPFPVFDASASKTVYPVSCYDPICAGWLSVAACYLRANICFYLDSYGDKSIAAGQMVRDTLTFKAPEGNGGTVVVPNIAFGCGLYNQGMFRSNESGIAGFARGAQSLPAQLKVGKFSYCFTSMQEEHAKSSPVFLGTPDDIHGHATGPVQSTPMPRYGNRPFYYLLFKGITVGKTRLPIDESVFAYKGDGKGGTVIDSGTGTTTFPKAVYDHLAAAFASQMRLPLVNASEVGGMLCFSLPEGADEKKVHVPELVFHLQGADMDLPRENYMLAADGIMCLMIHGAEIDETLIGNYQQQNMHIIYDLDNNKLLFAPVQCDKL